MSSEEEYIPECQKKKKWRKIKMPSRLSNGDVQPVQTETTGESSSVFSVSEADTNDSAVITTNKNSNVNSDSDVEDFEVTVRTKKSVRPLTDSDNESLEKSKDDTTKSINNNNNKDNAWDSDCSDGQSEKCPICLSRFLGQDIGNPESCDHSFCLDCLLEWAKKVNTCPVDRLPFMLILVRQKLEGNIVHRIPAGTWKSSESWASLSEQSDEETDLTSCEICGQCDREDRLLLCDSCDLGYHCECLDPPLNNVPIGEWFCPNCDTDWQERDLPEDLRAEFQEMIRSHFRPGSSVFQHRLIARTSAIETVRNRVKRRREAQLENIRNLMTNGSSVIRSVTKRRFAHRLGLQRTTQSIIQDSALPYSNCIHAESEQYQDEDVSYGSSSDEDNGYMTDRYQGVTSYRYSSRQLSAPVPTPRPAPIQRIRVPSPPVNSTNVDILGSILQTQSALHSHSQDIVIEKDGSLTLKSSGSPQQRPQNPLQQSVSSEKSGTSPSGTSCISESSKSQPRINQWYSSYSSGRDLIVGSSNSGSHCDEHNPGHYTSNSCSDNRKKDHNRSGRSKETKTQSEDEVDIYSDIESVGDEIIEDEPDIISNEHCSVTNVYRCDLQLDAMEEETDSSENELIIDEDAKGEEEDDSPNREWNEENSRGSTEEENSQNDLPSLDENKQSPEFSDYNINNVEENERKRKWNEEDSSCSTEEENSQNYIPLVGENKESPEISDYNINLEENESNDVINISNQDIFHTKIPYNDPNNENQYTKDEINDDESTENGYDVLENLERDEVSSEEETEQGNKIDSEESLSPINNDCTNVNEVSLSPTNNAINKSDMEESQPYIGNEINKSDMEESLPSINNEANKSDMEESLPSINNEANKSDMEESLPSINNEANKSDMEESLPSINNEANKSDMDESLPSINNEANKSENEESLPSVNNDVNKSDLEESLSSINNEETTNKSDTEESLSPMNNKINRSDLEESGSSVYNDRINEANIENDSSSENDSFPHGECIVSESEITDVQEGNNDFDENKSSGTCISNDNENNYYDIKNVNTSVVTDDQIFDETNLEEKPSCINITNDHSVMHIEEENESQDDDAKCDTETNEISYNFVEVTDYGKPVEITKIDEFKCLNIEKNLNKQIKEMDDNIVTKISEKSYSIMPAEDVEDISEAGSDDTKFKDNVEDWKVNENVLDSISSSHTVSKKELDDVEEQVAKLFEDEDSFTTHEKTKDYSNYKEVGMHKEHISSKTHILYEDREEGEIIEDLPVRHKSRCRKGHRRQSSNQDEIDYGDHAPRINMSVLPRIPKIKRDKSKSDIIEAVTDSKRATVLSRLDASSLSEVSWKKLSRSTRERSYRDGRPKDDRLLFREREIKQKLKRDEERTKKDDETRKKEDRYKRSESDKWKERVDHEHLKNRNERQKESLHEKSDKRVEKEWKSDKFHDKKDVKEKSHEKSHRDEKNYRDKYKHKHNKDNKDHKVDKDKFQEKEKYVHTHHSREREHKEKQKDRSSKKLETKFKTSTEKKDIRKDKTDKISEKKVIKHEKKQRDEGRHHYEHRKKGEIPYPEISAIESKEIYTKGDSIIINVNFNRNSGKEICIDDAKNTQKDIKRTKVKDKFSIDERSENVKYGKQRHISDLERSEISSTKPVEKYESKKKLVVEKVQVGEMLWKETEEMQQQCDDELDDEVIADEEDDDDDDDQSDNFQLPNSPESIISEKIAEKTELLHVKKPSSPFNNKSNVSTSPISCESPKRRSPRSPSPPSPTGNDSYDPCDPTISPFLDKSSSPEESHISVDNKPKPPPSPELPPLPVEPEPSYCSPSHEKDFRSSCLEKNNSSLDYRNVSNSTPIKATPVTPNPMCPSQPSHFSLPNVNIPPPNYISQTVSNNIISNTNIQPLMPGIPNWNVGSTRMLFPTQGTQPHNPGSFVSSHMAHGIVHQKSPLLPTPILPPTQHPHAIRSPMTFIPTIPNIRVPPPQIPANLNQQLQSFQPFIANQISSSLNSSTSSSIVTKSSLDVTETIDMDLDSPYSLQESPVLNTSKSVSQISTITKDKFDALFSSVVKMPSEKRHRESAKVLAEKVKQSHLLSKSVLTALDRINKKMLSASRLESALSSCAKRSKLDTKCDSSKTRYSSRTDTVKANVSSKKESKSSEKKEVSVKMNETQLTILDDLPSSAVEMQFLKKLNRQERVVEEVKLALKPYYNRREIDKEEYKEIMRKSVPKVCHNRSGDINPVKIKTLVEGYVKKFKHHRKKMEKLQKSKIS